MSKNKNLIIMKNEISRRQFVKGSIAAGVTIPQTDDPTLLLERVRKPLIAAVRESPR